MNFTVQDVASSLIACFLFGAVAFAPGYVIGWATNVFEFRRRSTGLQAIITCPLSIACEPIITYAIGRISSFRIAIAVHVLIAVCFVVLAGAFTFRRIRSGRPFKIRTPLAVAGVVIGWVILAVGSLVDVQIGDRLYSSVVQYDYSVRTAVTDAISRSGIPPQNPFFCPGRPVPLRYHYFWPAAASVVDELGGSAVDPRQAFIAGTVWCGLGLAAVAALYMLLFHPAGESGFRRRAWIAAGLFAVTGLDLLPNLAFAAAGVILPEMEWWNEQVTSWTGAVLWVPHHAAALVACATGFLLLWHGASAAGRRARGVACVLAALAFASAAGMSVYVVLPFALFVGLWLLLALTEKRLRDAAIIAGSGVLALALVSPYLLSLRSSGADVAFIELHVRDFAPIAGLLSGHGQWIRELGNALALPVNYFFEFGFFAVAGMDWWWLLRKRPASRRYTAGVLLMLAASLLVCTFLRSRVIVANDLGWRAAMPAQFALLIAAADLIDFLYATRQARTARLGVLRPALGVLLVIGALGTLWELGILRMHPILFGTRPGPNFTEAQRRFALRRVYDEVKLRTPRNTIVQHNPAVIPNDFPFGLYANRQGAAENRTCGTDFGGDLAACGKLLPGIQALFAGGPSDRGLVTAERACAAWGIEVLIAKDTDPVWNDKESWVWKGSALTGNAQARAIRCGPSQTAKRPFRPLS